MRPAIFLDRDGVINENRPDYVKSWEEFHFLPGVLEALRRLSAGSRPVVVVTNQSVVGRGVISPRMLALIHDRMLWEVADAGGRIDALYICPHHPHDGCDCRKPAPGLLRRAAVELGLDLAASVFIGDSFSDVAAARAAGVQPIFVRSGQDGIRLREPAAQTLLDGCPVVDDLAAAVTRLL